MQVKISPRSPDEKGGILLMPMKKNIKHPKNGWKRVKCPVCGQKCYRNAHPEWIRAQQLRAMCTECGLKEQFGMNK